MAPVVHTPVEDFTGTVAGVAFANGVGETDNPAALAYFQRKGYEIEGGHSAPPAGTPLTEEELARVAAAEATRDSGAVPPDQSQELTPPPVDHSHGVPASGEQESSPADDRPHPVRGSKAEWFAYLDGLNPGHGFDLEKVSRKELIAAVEAIDAAKVATPE